MTNYLITFARKYTANYNGLPKYCWLGIALICINTFTIGICFFLSLYFVNTLRFTTSMVGLLLSCYGFGTVTGGFITGKGLDIVSTRFVSVFSLLVQSASFFLLIYTQSAFVLMPILFLLGFAAYGFKTSNNAWILGMCTDNSNLRYRAIGISHVAGNLGLGLSGVFIGNMATNGFESIFYLSSILLLCSALYLVLQKSPGVYKAHSTNELGNHGRSHNSTMILLILLCVFLVGLIIAQLGSTYPLYIQELFPLTGIKLVSLLFILDTFLIVFFQVPITTLVSNLDKLLVTGFGAFFMGLGMLILVYSNTYAVAIISCIVWTTGEMLFISTAQHLCYEYSNNHRKGRSLGLFQTAFATSNVVGPVLGGIIYQYWGGNLLWYCSMIIGVLCFLLCWYFSKRRLG